jgi:hypothetical protein
LIQTEPSAHGGLGCSGGSAAKNGIHWIAGSNPQEQKHQGGD